MKFKVITYCDFGEPFRKTELAKHKTLRTAHNQYKRIWDIYGRIYKYKVWQEEATP